MPEFDSTAQTSLTEYKYALCLVDIKVLGTRTFSYLIPDEIKETIKIGQPVMVPFGNAKGGGRKIKAYVVGFSNYLKRELKQKRLMKFLIQRQCSALNI